MTGTERRQTGRGGRRTTARRYTAAFRNASGDLLALLSLSLVLGGLLAYVALLPPTRLAFTVDQLPLGVALSGFYGPEENEAGPYRWTKPEASLLVPVAAPADYRVTLTLGASAEAPAGGARPVAVAINGVPAGTVQLEPAPRDYSFQHRLDGREWRPGARETLSIELRSAPFVPPGDPRPLGVIVKGLAVEPARAPTPWQPALLAPHLLLLALGYGALRALGLPPRGVALALGLPLAALASATLGARPTTLFLLYQPLYQPLWLFGAALFLSPLPFVARAWPGRGPRGGGRGTEGNGEQRSGEAEGYVPPPHLTPHGLRRLLLPAAVVTLAFGLRLYRYDALSLWLDEGFTIVFARLPWPAVLGLQGQYDVHPPLYYLLVKLISTVAPEVGAGRLLSVLAGTATVGVVYALAARLAGRAAALCAGLILAVSPLHLWYSQEARMYALAAFAVSLSYLALVGFYQEVSPRWALVYGIAVLAAMYTDYSVVYALTPQVFLHALLTKTHGRRVLPIAVATVGAVLAYLPWLVRALPSLRLAANKEADYLAVTWSKIGNSLLAIIGVGGRSHEYWGNAQTPWVTLATLQSAFLLLAAPALTVGAMALIRRSLVGPAVATSLLTGTLGTATVVSLLSPGYADKTVLYAIIGWATLAGAAPFGKGPGWLNGAGSISLTFVLTISLLSIVAIYRGSDKQHYRELAAALASASPQGIPIITNDSVTATLIDVYQPGTLDGRHLDLEGDRPFIPPPPGNLDAFWFVYGDYPWHDTARIHQHLAARGYQRTGRKQIPGPLYPLYLDLYTRPGVDRPGGRSAGHTPPARPGSADPSEHNATARLRRLNHDNGLPCTDLVRGSTIHRSVDSGSHCRRQRCGRLEHILGAIH